MHGKACNYLLHFRGGCGGHLPREHSLAKKQGEPLAVPGVAWGRWGGLG